MTPRRRFLVDLTVIVKAVDEQAARTYLKNALEAKNAVERVGDIRVGPLPPLPIRGPE